MHLLEPLLSSTIQTKARGVHVINKKIQNFWCKLDVSLTLVCLPYQE